MARNRLTNCITKREAILYDHPLHLSRTTRLFCENKIGMLLLRVYR